MATASRGAFVEIVESHEHVGSNHVLVKPSALRVNGTDVGYFSDCQVSTDMNDVVRVTVELLPDRIEIKSESDEEIETPLRWRVKYRLRRQDYRKAAPYAAVAALVAWLAHR